MQRLQFKLHTVCIQCNTGNITKTVPSAHQKGCGEPRQIFIHTKKKEKEEADEIKR
jgi:hypothetical protein